MDVAVHLIGSYLLNPLLPTAYHAPNYWLTQYIACCILNYTGGIVFYFSIAGSSYYYFFRWKRAQYYPSTLPNDLTEQVRVEIGIAMRSLPVMALAFSPFTFGVTRGWSKMYHSVDDYGWPYLIFSVFLFLFITDFMIYFIHRGLHIPVLYNNIHKPHHTYRFTTPFSSHAFHWADGFAQGIPYYIFVYFFPFHWLVWIVMFIFVNCWTILIHDQVDFTGGIMFIMSTGHHTIHHSHFKYNYGQYFTLWDRIGGTHLQANPTHDIFTGKKLAGFSKEE